MNIVLTGFMGTGKTVTAKKMAAALKMKNIDIDEAIEADAKKSIALIFQENGESHFREVEKKVIRCVALLDNFVISTGGGVVLKKENMDELETNGIVICLTAAPDVIYRRIKNTEYRPLLNVRNPQEKIKELMEKRKPFYKRCSMMIDTSNMALDEVVEKIIQFINKSGKK